MASDDLEQSLRAEVENYIQGRVSALHNEIEHLHSQVNEALTRLTERLWSETQTDASVAVAIAEHLRAAHEKGTEQAAEASARTRASSNMALIKAAVEDIDNQRTQADILNALVNRAAAFAPRVAFFVIRNERATGWRARGLEGSIGDDRVREISLPLEADTLLGEAVRTRSTWSGTPGAHADDHTLFTSLGSEPPQHIMAIPLLARGKAVAVLYADSAALDAESLNLEALETLVRVTGMAVELLATKRPSPDAASRAAEASAARPMPTPPPETPAPQIAEEVPPAPPEEPEPPAPEPVHEPTPLPTGVWPAPPAVESISPTEEESPAPTVEAAEAPAADYGRPEETPPPAATETGAPVEAADAGSQPSAPPAASAPLGTSRRYGGAEAELPVEVTEEDRRYHNDARRFARLLVSEIKLYNEQKVKEGRAQSDLYDRLREEIDRSRQMYDKRVAPQVASRYDYFYHELVNTLAEGDAGKLGQNYPGAASSA